MHKNTRLVSAGILEANKEKEIQEFDASVRAANEKEPPTKYGLSKLSLQERLDQNMEKNLKSGVSTLSHTQSLRKALSLA